MSESTEVRKVPFLRITGLVLALLSAALLIFSFISKFRLSGVTVRDARDLPFYTYEIYYGAGQDYCFYPNCGEIATQESSASIFGGNYVKTVKSLKNKANFSIIEEVITVDETTVGKYTDNYLTLTPDGDSFRVDEHNDVYEYTYKTGSHESTYLEIEGLYCDEHIDTAILTLNEEYAGAFNSNICFKLGVKFYPWVLIPIFILFWSACLLCLCGKSNTHKFIIVFLSAIILACIIAIVLMMGLL